MFALLLALALVACGEDKPGTTADVPTVDPDVTEPELGTASLALSLPNSSVIERVEYKLTFTYLESQPPQDYLYEEYTAVQHGGALTAVLPCQTTPDGTGLNQVHVEALVKVRNLATPVTVHAYAIFDCRRNADTAVNIVLNIVSQLDAGFVDLALAASGTLCAGKVDYLNDGYLGVCADSSCGDSESVFLFANTCETVSGGEPHYWVCGTPSDWTLSGTLATSRFPIPAADGTYTFGLFALDPLHMIQVDPTLTDDEGYLKVWVGIARTIGTFTREGGVNVTESHTVSLRDFAVELQTPPQAPGQPAPKLLLTGKNTEAGVDVWFQRPFGECDQRPTGLSLYDDYILRDVRLVSESKARLLMMDVNHSWLTTAAVCEAGWTEDGQPTIDCGIPGSILP